jgi:hypothetical protein
MAQIEKEDFTEIEDLRNKLALIVSETGQSTLQIRLMESDIEELKSKIKENSVKFKGLLNQERELIKRLSEKYGAGEINFETGEFTSER